MSPRWRKVLSDLWSNKLRTLLVVLSIAVGVFGTGTIVSAYIIIDRDIDADFLSVNPHSAILYTEPYNEELLKTAAQVPGVAMTEGRSSFVTRVAKGAGDWRNIQVTGIPPLDTIKINRLRYDKPIMLGNQEILMERSNKLIAQDIQVGDIVRLEVSNERVRELKVVGFVHDINTFPAPISGQLNGYVNLETMDWLGQGDRFNQILLTVSEGGSDEAHVREIGTAVADRIERSGFPVYFTLVFRPGGHPFKSIVTSLLALMSGLGVFLVFLSGFLVINTVSALLTQHVRQIGVMKAVGAKVYQIGMMYIVLVIIFGLLAALVAVPLSALAGRALSAFVASFMNFDLSDAKIPVESIVVQFVVALGVPVFAAIWPIWRGTRLTIREAISNYGLGQGHFGQGLIDRTLEKVRFLSRPLLISLRNTFRRKGRLLLTLSTLTLAGAIFIAVFNTRASLNQTIEETFGYFLSDINIDLERPYRMRQIEQLALSVPGVAEVEGWLGATAQIMQDGEDTGEQVQIIAPPSTSTLIDPVLTSGRWLIPEDDKAVVIGNHLIQRRPDLKVGDTLTFDIQGRESKWTIVGIFKMAGNVEPPMVYVNGEVLARELNYLGRTTAFRAVTHLHDKQSQERVSEALQARLDAAGVQVSNIQISTVLQEQNEVSTNILMVFLLSMAILIAVVGGLGLMGTMSMNVIERTREIGVLRAIGASDGAVLKLVLVEGLLIGMISWGLGALLAVPISQGLSAAVGLSFVTVPLPFVFSWDGFLIWLVVVLILSALASFLPAYGASRLTVRDVLAYE